MAMGRLQLASHTSAAVKRMPREGESAAPLGTSSGAPSNQAGNLAGAPSPFSQMLLSATPATSAEPEARRTFEFSSLGMFGLNATAAEEGQSAADETKGGAVKAVDAAAVTALEPDGPEQSEQMGREDVAAGVANGPSAWGAYPGDLARDIRTSSASEAATTGASASSVASVVFGADSPRFAVITPTNDEAIEAGTANMIALSSAPREQVSDTSAVFVFGPDEAAQIAVRIPDAGGDAGVFRDAIERTAAEYGVQVGELTINGSVNPSAFSLKENSRGRNTR